MSGRHVRDAAYIRDAVMDYQRRTVLSERDERTILASRDRMMTLAMQLDDAESEIAPLQAVKAAAIELEAALRTDGADWIKPIKRLQTALKKAEPRQ